jgi:TolB protein
LIPAGQSGEIQGTNPVWTSNDMIAFKACNSWSGFGKCGIYLVPSSSTKGLSDGYIPRQLTQGLSDTPTDTKSDLIAFMSTHDGNWEAYVMDLNGDGVKNLSDSPNSSDGLPTISPDGNWLAFISDRDGLWAFWVAPLVGGPAQKLFDLPVAIPWGTKDLDWTNERISWGP